MLKSMIFKPGIWLAGSKAASQSEAMLENVLTNMEFHMNFYLVIQAPWARAPGHQQPQYWHPPGYVSHCLRVNPFHAKLFWKKK